ncbi:HAMP domain-containing histidine kinase [Mycolicibacterium novocastrense]|nr:HAMP domain-containing histidine kinase [Mycolicibacterium novocastrense]
MSEWYRWPSDGMLGQPLREVHSGEHRRQLEPYIDRALSGESVSFEMAERNHAGQQRYMLRSYVPNRQANGEVAGIFVLIQDITDRRRTAEALHQAYQNLEQRVRERTAELTSLNDQLLREIDERSHAEARLREAKREAEVANLSKTKFLAAVSHDLLQPLNAARLFTSALLEQPGTSSSGLIRNISNPLEDVENLLGTLVDISKLDAGVIKPDIAPFAVSELLENLAMEFRQIAGAEQLQLDFIPCSAPVRSDIQLLARILRNLLTNAIRYTPNGRVLLGCRRHRQSLVHRGLGYRRRHRLGQAWRKSFRVQARRGRATESGSRPRSGSGHRRQDRPHARPSHPGQPRIRAAVPASPSTPLAKRAPKARPEPSTTELVLQRLQGARVWVLDNDTAICAGMRTLLEGWGCKVITALSDGRPGAAGGQLPRRGRSDDRRLPLGQRPHRHRCGGSPSMRGAPARSRP